MVLEVKPSEDMDQSICISTRADAGRSCDYWTGPAKNCGMSRGAAKLHHLG